MAPTGHELIDFIGSIRLLNEILWLWLGYEIAAMEDFVKLGDGGKRITLADVGADTFEILDPSPTHDHVPAPGVVNEKPYSDKPWAESVEPGPDPQVIPDGPYDDTLHPSGSAYQTPVDWWIDPLEVYAVVNHNVTDDLQVWYVVHWRLPAS